MTSVSENKNSNHFDWGGTCCRDWSSTRGVGLNKRLVCGFKSRVQRGLWVLSCTCVGRAFQYPLLTCESPIFRLGFTVNTFGGEQNSKNEVQVHTLVL